MLQEIGLHRILSADQWMQRAIDGKLRPVDVCLTFDDTLRCQFDVAFPILQELRLTAFWFVYTSVCRGQVERLEIYRHFRTTCFQSVDEFYGDWWALVEQMGMGPDVRRADSRFDPRQYLKEFPFYSQTDRHFRFVRDEVLGPQRYGQVMDRMMKEKQFDVAAAARGLWMGDEELKRLHAAGQGIGLHSHTHPTRIERLEVESQRREYRENFEHLAGLLGKKPRAMSHPCNSYNQDTFDILRELGIVLGFRANMAKPVASPFEHPREDHSNLVRAMAA